MNKYRIGTDIPFRVQIAEGDNAFDWADITVKQVAMYSDSRQAFAGLCTHEVDEDDSTWLDCIYPANVQVLTGALRLVVIFDREGRTLTYDLADVFGLVSESSEADSDGDTVTDAHITVSGLPISVISEILRACVAATAQATSAAGAANGSVISEVSYTASAEDGGNNVLHIEQADGTEYNFNIKNGSKGAQGATGATGPQGERGLKGDTGVSADYPITIYNGLDSDATDQALAAAQGKVLNGKISQLEYDLTGLEKTPFDDFAITDGQDNAIATFRDGGIKTKNFDSSITPFSGDAVLADLDIADEQNNVILRIIGGHIKTKHFDSEGIELPQNLPGATDVFVSAMRKKTAKMGLSITINGPAGYPDNQVSDARSMAKLFLVASGYRELVTIWNTKDDVTIKSKGNVSGTHLLHSTVFSTDSQGHYANQLTDYYTMLGGKTGTWSSPRYNMLGAIIKGPDDVLFSAWLRRNAGEDSTNNRWKSMKILMDIAFLKVQNPSADISSLEDSLVASGVNSAQVLRIPNGYPVNYELFDFFGDDSRYAEYAVYGYSNTTQLPIASTTKVITAITALDFISDLEKLVEIQSSDIISGSTSTNPEFTPGEKFSVRELLLSMMMPSSNAAANALARYVGSMLILNKY